MTRSKIVDNLLLATLLFALCAGNVILLAQVKLLERENRNLNKWFLEAQEDCGKALNIAVTERTWRIAAQNTLRKHGLENEAKR
jgi:hypothetical protein